MTLRFAKWITLVIAILIAICAGGFSVYGLGHLFGGASLAVMIMAGLLEVGKLVAASVLERHWKILGSGKYYATAAVIILMLITSAGIYGFLSSAYSTTSKELNIANQKIALIDAKKERYLQSKLDYESEKIKLNTSIADLRESLGNPAQIQYIDRETGEKITTTSSATRRTLENQLNKALDNREILNNKLQISIDSITSLEIQKIEANANNSAESELSTVKFFANFVGWTMDQAANTLILIFISVFDPFAVILILISNRLFEKDEKKKNKTKQSSKEFFNEIQNNIFRSDSQFRTSFPEPSKELGRDSIEFPGERTNKDEENLSEEKIEIKVQDKIQLDDNLMEKLESKKEELKKPNNSQAGKKGRVPIDIHKLKEEK